MLTISNPSAGITLGTTVTQNVSIIDDDPAPTLTINNVSQTEGNSGTTTFTFTVTSSAALEMPITVNYATADGTATTPGDYTAVTNGTVTIAASSTTGSATVLVNGDTTVEPDENFTVTLSNPVNATIASGTGTGTIQNDDIPTITVSPATLPDGTVGVAYNQTITASGGASPYMFSFTGNLPTGLTLSTSGILSGTPTTAGTYNFTVTATDSSNYTGSQAYTVMISVPDTTAPTVGYTVLTATNDTLNRVLPVEIDDNIGVSSGANAPRIYYRKGTSDYVSTQCSLSGTTPNYNCTIDYAVLGGAAAGDFISYFVVAQDDAGNITSNPAGAAGNVNGLILPADFAPNGYAIGSANIPTGTYTSLESNDANVVGAVMVLANMKLNGIVKVMSGGLLTFDCGTTVTGAGETVFVTGNVRKNFCTNQSPDNTFTFPVGSNAFGQPLAEDNLSNGVQAGESYSPMTTTVTALSSPGSLTVSVTDAALPNSSPSQSLSRYWTLTKNGGLDQANLSFKYRDEDVNGDENSYSVLKRDTTITNIVAGGTVDAAANTFSVNNVTSFSDWSAGNLAPLAAEASISGSVKTADGRGISGAIIRVIGNGMSEPRIVRTSAFGRYRVNGLTAGETYVLSVTSKRFIFNNPSRVISLHDDFDDADFIAEP